MATTNTCNAACSFCVYPREENDLPKVTMSMDLYRKIIDEAKDIESIDTIAFSALGEPLLDRFLEDRIRYLKQARPSWSPIELYTNGVALTPKRFEALKEAGLDSLSISLNAINQKQHEKVMGLKGKFGQVCSNARYAIDHADGKVNVHIKAVFSGDDFTEEDQMRFYLTWGIKQYGGYGICVRERNWANQIGRTMDDSFDPNKCCFRALEQISILSDGRVTMCCFDPLDKFPLGDLKRQSIKEIYNSDKYVKFREAHNEDRAAEYDLCKNCTRV
jgi:radical SAM protein with 4Fe4S-binding SPASM domain